MAKYVDTLQKNRKKTEGELEKELKDVMTLFRYLQDKDVFEEFYKNLLSKVRLSAFEQELCEPTAFRGPLYLLTPHKTTHTHTHDSASSATKAAAST